MTIVNGVITVCNYCIEIDRLMRLRNGLEINVNRIQAVIMNQLNSNVEQIGLVNLSNSILDNFSLVKQTKDNIEWLTSRIKELDHVHKPLEDQQKMIDSFFAPCSVCEKIQNLTQQKIAIDQKIQIAKAEEGEYPSMETESLEMLSCDFDKQIERLKQEIPH